MSRCGFHQEPTTLWVGLVSSINTELVCKGSANQIPFFDDELFVESKCLFGVDLGCRNVGSDKDDLDDELEFRWEDTGIGCLVAKLEYKCALVAFSVTAMLNIEGFADDMSGVGVELVTNVIGVVMLSVKLGCRDVENDMDDLDDEFEFAWEDTGIDDEYATNSICLVMVSLLRAEGKCRDTGCGLCCFDNELTNETVYWIMASLLEEKLIGTDINDDILSVKSASGFVRMDISSFRTDLEDGDLDDDMFCFVDEPVTMFICFVMVSISNDTF